MRTNQQWLNDLRAQPPITEAVAELRNYLKRGLGSAMSRRSEVGEADLDDFAQDAVIRILDRLDSFRGDSKFTTWAMAVAIRVAYSTMRRRRWGDCSLDDLGLTPDASTQEASTDPAAASARDDVLTALRHAIDRDLTPRQRAAILGELAGMPTETLAEQLGTNTNALYKLHHDARLRLRGALEKAGFSEMDVRNAVEGASQ